MQFWVIHSCRNRWGGGGGGWLNNDKINKVIQNGIGNGFLSLVPPPLLISFHVNVITSFKYFKSGKSNL